MRSPPHIALEPLRQAHRVVVRIEKLVDDERQLVMLCESSAGWASSGSAAYN
jgi:hypothetical protein